MKKNNSWIIQASADMSHPNRRAFTGVLTTVDVPSDMSPTGAKGHRVIVTRRAVQDALPSLIGMGIDYKAGWDGHNERQKCGVITDAYLDGNKLLVEGYAYIRDFPDLTHAATLSGDKELGMSYEICDAHVANTKQTIWTLPKFTFTGAAVLYRVKAAYRSTSFKLVRDLDRFSDAVVPDTPGTLCMTSEME